MATEPTSVLTFNDLLIEVAYKIGVNSYGDDGAGAPQLPTDDHDLFICKKIVNDAIRMFIHDAPKQNGWRWLRPISQLDLWPTIAENAANPIATAVYSSGTGLTTITVTTASFFPSMELRTIAFHDGSTAIVNGYISPLSVTLTGDFHLKVASLWSITTTGDYTLPIGFGGQFDGHPTFVAGTNRGTTLSWTDESVIRERRSNMNQETGTPYMMAVRLMSVGAPRRRWEMMFYRMPSEFLSVLFPYTLHFDSLVNLTDVSPAPFGHDETVKAACLAVAEKKVEDAPGPDWQYYRDTCLPNSYRLDAQSAPKNLGYFGNPSARRGNSISDFRNNWYQRPTVPFNQ